MESSIIVVSGIPRSGTSMMMKMLQAGGIDILMDDLRPADTDNPQGYFEYHKVKNLKTDNSWLHEAKGKAVKVISQLLYYLPPIYDYKIIFMLRNMREILASQKKMLDRLGTTTNEIDDALLAKKFEEHLKKVTSWIKMQRNMQCLFVDYNEIILSQEPFAHNVCRFLGNVIDSKAMVKAIDRSLYRNRF